ncbi:MAG: GFA family protein [Anaerolineae bacterium]|nr:GFA family protein [Anaerolineae bacterium]
MSTSGVVKTIQTSGSCHCGKVEYTVSGSILGQSYCDCKACQKATGTLKVPFITVSRDSFSLTQGELSIVHGSTGVKCDNYGVWYHCPECGTNLYWAPHQGEQIDILVGTLDDVSVFNLKA